MRTILVPFDGSKAAQRALDVAVDLAVQHGASIILLHVLLHDAEADQLLGLPGLSDASREVVDELRRLAQTPEPTRTIEEEMAKPNFPNQTSDFRCSSVPIKLTYRCLRRSRVTGSSGGSPSPSSEGLRSLTEDNA